MRTLKNYGLKFTSLMVILLTMFSCHKDSISEDSIRFDDSGAEQVESHLFGRIGNENGDPILASIEVNDYNSFCELSGSFDFGRLGMKKDGQVIKINHTGYTPHYQWISPDLGSTDFIDIVLKDYKLTESCLLSQENITIGNSNFSYSNEGFSIQGDTYKGNYVSFDLHDVFAPNVENHIPLPMPDFTISDETMRRLEMVELFYLKIRGDQNDQLDIARNHGIVLDKAISSYSSNINDYQLYFWDEYEDRWRPASDIVVEGDLMKFWLDRTGWWCVAKEAPGEVQSFALDLEDEPLAFQKLIVESKESDFSKIIHTNDRGIAHAVLDANEKYQVRFIDYCDVAAETVDFTPIEGDIFISADISDHVMNTSIFDCDDQPVTDELFLIKQNGRYLPIKPNMNGNVLIYLSSYYNGEFFQLENPRNDEYYFLSKTLLKAGNQDSTWICDDFEVGGMIERSNQVVQIDSTLRAAIDTSNLRIYLSYQLFGGIEEFIITEISSNAIQGYASGNVFNSDKEDHSIRFNIHQISGLGGLLILDFEGNVNILRSTQTDDIKGSLVARIEGFK